MLTATLETGTRIHFNGDIWTVVAIGSNCVTISHPLKGAQVVNTSSLLTFDDFSVVSMGAAPEGLGHSFQAMPASKHHGLITMESHIRECLTGYQSGTAESPLPGEPRSEYDPLLDKLTRYDNKARELGISRRTLQRQIAGYQNDGLIALMDLRKERSATKLGRVDPEWEKILREVINEHSPKSQPSRNILIDRTNHRYVARDATRVPVRRSTALRVISRVTKGMNVFMGTSSKQKRSIAGRPESPYRGIKSSRLGEYILLDTTPLDVYAMSRYTLQWEPVQLTVALELSTRSITGIRLSPVSARAVDTALVLYETISPNSRSHTGHGALPYAGVPTHVGFEDEADRPDLTMPSVAPDTIMIDHGKMYTATHVRGICQRLGISIQPARLYKGTDKAPLERFFRTIREGLLEALPGYKGPDVFSRGHNVEKDAFYFIDELETIIREWITEVYHQRPHAGLRNLHIPGIDISPAQAWQMGLATAGGISIPVHPGLLYDFLPIMWRTIQHDGVSVGGMKFDGLGLNGFRNASSPYPDRGGKWPIRYDPDDARCVFFQRPDDNSWAKLAWKHSGDDIQPFSFETMTIARQHALSQHKAIDDRTALMTLLKRWDIGEVAGRTERSAQARQSRSMRDDLKRLTETDLATLVEDTMEWDDASSTHHVSPSELINEADQSTGWLEGSDDDDYEEDDDTANGPEDGSDIDEVSYYAHAFRI